MDKEAILFVNLQKVVPFLVFLNQIEEEYNLYSNDDESILLKEFEGFFTEIKSENKDLKI